MPYDNIPQNLWAKMDRCVDAVLKDNPSYDKGRAIAVCHSTVAEAGVPDYSDGAMIGLKVPDTVAQQIALDMPGALPPGDLHMTLAWLGKVVDIKATREELVDRLLPLTQQVAIQGSINGPARFTSVDQDGTEPLVLLVDSPSLTGFWQDVAWKMRRFDWMPERNHGRIPHITLAYIPKTDPWPAMKYNHEPFNFDALYLVWGNEWVRMPFAVELAPEDSAVQPMAESLRDCRETYTALMAEVSADAEGNLGGAIIVEGLSENGKNYYTENALKTIPQVLANAPIFVNHDTKKQREDRPEGDVTRLIGRLPSDPKHFTITPRADGLRVARFQSGKMSTSPADRWAVDRIAQGIIGALSIFIKGEGSDQRDGTFRVERFVSHPRNSVDLVTVGAAGGEATVT